MSNSTSKPQASRLLSDYVIERADRWLTADIRRTRAALARVSGLTPARVHDLLDRSRTPTQRTLRAIAHALGADFKDLEGSARRFAVERAPRRRQSPSPAESRLEARRTTPRDRYPNRVKAIQAARLVDHDERDIQTVAQVVLPPGARDPEPKVWLMWIEKAREERVQ